jgi:large subunit ribosomal protein L13
MKTYSAKPHEIQRQWYLVDADQETLGRLATRIADLLRGKGKTQYTPATSSSSSTPRRCA